MIYTKMKKMFFAAALMLAVIACGKDEKPVDPGQDEQSFPADYTGTVTVIYNEEEVDNPDITVTLRESETEGQLEIDMFQIRFVPTMPVTVDLTIPSVSYEVHPDGTLSLSADDVAPLYLGNPMEPYRVTGFTGKLDDKGLTFSLNFGSYPTSFTGVLAPE